jgi:hypothetical protein
MTKGNPFIYQSFVWNTCFTCLAHITTHSITKNVYKWVWILKRSEHISWAYKVLYILYNGVFHSLYNNFNNEQNGVIMTIYINEITTISFNAPVSKKPSCLYNKFEILWRLVITIRCISSLLSFLLRLSDWKRSDDDDGCYEVGGCLKQSYLTGRWDCKGLPLPWYQSKLPIRIAVTITLIGCFEAIFDRWELCVRIVLHRLLSLNSFFSYILLMRCDARQYVTSIHFLLEHTCCLYISSHSNHVPPNPFWKASRTSG